jgi:predicted nucleotidyltransferase
MRFYVTNLDIVNNTTPDLAVISSLRRKSSRFISVDSTVIEFDGKRYNTPTDVKSFLEGKEREFAKAFSFVLGDSVTETEEVDEPSAEVKL